MESFLPYFTADGSVGLFSEDFEDIYHSASGALTEAFEKFVLPIDLKNILENDIKVLDICYGLGYNSKSFLSYIGMNSSIEFDCLDINEKLIKLSPFIKTNTGNLNNKKILSHFNDKQINIINKYSKQNNKSKYQLNDMVNKILIKNLCDNLNNVILDDSMSNFFTFFDDSLLKFAKKYQKYRLFYTHRRIKPTFLHNIYYQYLSNRYKGVDNSPIKFNFYIDDARNTIKKLNNDYYDIVFLDAFTPSKCPQLWSLEFIQQIYNKIKPNGILLTYSSAAVVRNTFKLAGFNIGKIINTDKQIGTICSKNKLNIINPLNKYELGLLNTKTGIPYRDKNLNAEQSYIIKCREDEMSESSLMSSSKYKKEYSNEI